MRTAMVPKSGKVRSPNSIHSGPQIIAALEGAMPTAECGEVLISGMHLSQFELICESWDEHGFSFTTEDGSQPDPIGSINLTKDPSLPHEMAHSAVLAVLWEQLILLGLKQYFVLCGSTTLPFGQGHRKEADASLAFKREDTFNNIAAVQQDRELLYDRGLFQERTGLL